MGTQNMHAKDYSQIGVVVMASGLSKRFGSNKLLAELWGRPLLEHSLLALKQAGLSKIIVVTRSPSLRELLDKHGLKSILHSLPYQSDTVALGVQYWLESGLELKGLLFLAGDQPLLQPATLQRLCSSFLASYEVEPRAHIFRLAKLVKGELIPGNPVLFSPELFPELLQLPQDKGGSALCKKYPQLVQTVLAEPQELLDVDTKEDLEEIQLP